jgi:hypothetical protein
MMMENVVDIDWADVRVGPILLVFTTLVQQQQTGRSTAWGP